MNINWFKDPDHLVYINAEKSLAELEKRLKLPGLVQAADMLRLFLWKISTFISQVTSMQSVQLTTCWQL